MAQRGVEFEKDEEVEVEEGAAPPESNLSAGVIGATKL